MAFQTDQLIETIYQQLSLTPLDQDQLQELLSSVAAKLSVRLTPTFEGQLQVFDQVAFQDETGKTREGYVSAVHISEAGPDAIQLHYTFIASDETEHEIEHISGKFFQK